MPIPKPLLRVHLILLIPLLFTLHVFSFSFRWLAADATCKQWDLRKGTSKTLLIAERGLSDLAVCFNEGEGRMIALASDDKLVYLLKCKINDDKEDTRQPHGRQRNATQDQEEEFKNVLKLEGHLHHVFCVRFNSGGNLLASGSFDQSIRIWEPFTGTDRIDLTLY